MSGVDADSNMMSKLITRFDGLFIRDNDSNICLSWLNLLFETTTIFIMYSSDVSNEPSTYEEHNFAVLVDEYGEVGSSPFNLTLYT